VVEVKAEVKMKMEMARRRIERTALLPLLIPGKGCRDGATVGHVALAHLLLDTTRASLHCIMGYGRGRHIFIVLYKLLRKRSDGMASMYAES